MVRGRVAFVVLGCAKNQVEAESMSSRLAREGWEMTADLPNASVIVVHTSRSAAPFSVRMADLFEY